MNVGIDMGSRAIKLAAFHEGELVEHAVGRESTHLDRPLARRGRLAGIPEAQAAVVADHERHDAEVHVDRQPAVEPHLLLAEPAPVPRCAR